MRASFSVTCTAVYNADLNIPNELLKRDKEGKIAEESKEAIAEYIRNHLHECDIHNLEWVSDNEDFGGDITIEDNDGNESMFFAEWLQKYYNLCCFLLNVLNQNDIIGIKADTDYQSVHWYGQNVLFCLIIWQYLRKTILIKRKGNEYEEIYCSFV